MCKPSFQTWNFHEEHVTCGDGAVAKQPYADLYRRRIASFLASTVTLDEIISAAPLPLLQDHIQTPQKGWSEKVQ